MDAEPLSNNKNPKFLASDADTGFLKKIHTWAPLPDRDLSTNGVMPLILHISLRASTSSCHSSSTLAKSVCSAPFSWLSKSNTRNRHVPSARRGYTPNTSEPSSFIPSKWFMIFSGVSFVHSLCSHVSQLCFSPRCFGQRRLFQRLLHWGKYPPFAPLLAYTSVLPQNIEKYRFARSFAID